MSLAQYALEQFNIKLSPRQIEQFKIYHELLLEWNSIMNLTTIPPEEWEVRHFLDSLSLASVIGFDTGDKLIDVGTGAGFPGLPLAIAFPNIKVTLLESVNKKLNFCQSVIDKAGLKNVTTLHMRAEDAGRDLKHREKYNIVTARAVARLPVLIEYMIPLAKKGGFCIAMKGESAAEEITDARAALMTLHGQAHPLTELQLPNVENKHYLVVVEKFGSTPKTYPRQAGMPKKKPIGL